MVHLTPGTAFCLVHRGLKNGNFDLLPSFLDSTAILGMMGQGRGHAVARVPEVVGAREEHGRRVDVDPGPTT